MGDAMKWIDPGGGALGLYDGPPDYAGEAKKQEKNRQKAILEGTAKIDNAFAGYTPDFYNQRALAYQQYALPQLANQYLQTQKAIGFGLANRGLQNSSAAQGQYSRLNREMGVQKQGIADAGTAQARELQQQVEAQKNTLLGQLYQSANPTLAGQKATSYAASLASPSVFAPLGNMFSNLLNQYYTRQMLSTYRPTSYINVPESSYNNSGALAPVTYGGTQ
jgi:hypothetical protein